jgi:hypothetical protein
VITGAGLVTVKFLLLIAVPWLVTTLIGPVVAPEGTVAWTCVDVAVPHAVLVPLKSTDVQGVRLWPVIVTDVPIGPLTGVNAVMEGALLFAYTGTAVVNALATATTTAAAVPLVHADRRAKLRTPASDDLAEMFVVPASMVIASLVLASYCTAKVPMAGSVHVEVEAALRHA